MHIYVLVWYTTLYLCAYCMFDKFYYKLIHTVNNLIVQVNICVFQFFVCYHNACCTNSVLMHLTPCSCKTGVPVYI